MGRWLSGVLPNFSKDPAFLRPEFIWQWLFSVVLRTDSDFASHTILWVLFSMRRLWPFSSVIAWCIVDQTQISIEAGGDDLEG